MPLTVTACGLLSEALLRQRESRSPGKRILLGCRTRRRPRGMQMAGAWLDRTGGIVGGIRIRHVKIPVTDLARSVGWYRDLLELALAAEFCEEGSLRGAQLMHPSGFGIALREREYCSSTPDLTGFDVVAFELDSVAELERVA